MPTASFPWVRTKRNNMPILPIFLPFAGCKTRCIYCAQNIQTGVPEAKDKNAFLCQALDEAQRMLLERSARNLAPCELAFFGGTFTAQHDEAFGMCLARVKEWMQRGFVASWRCSTRPDCVDKEKLQKMRDAGCSCVELGIQSFEESVLKKALRGYSPSVAKEAIATVLSEGLLCGVQLLPGLPLSTPQGFIDDVKEAIGLGASFFRFYPCLVFPGTGLAKLYQQGLYTPWTLEETADALAEGLLLCTQAGRAVIRIGVANEPGLTQKLLAGPFDQAMGTRALALSLLKQIQRTLPAEMPAKKMTAPRFCQGYLFGEKRELAKEYERIGLKAGQIFFSDTEMVKIDY